MAEKGSLFRRLIRGVTGEDVHQAEMAFVRALHEEVNAGMAQTRAEVDAFLAKGAQMDKTPQFDMTTIEGMHQAESAMSRALHEEVNAGIARTRAEVDAFIAQRSAGDSKLAAGEGKFTGNPKTNGSREKDGGAQR